MPITISTDLCVLAGQLDPASVKRDQKVLIVESWVHLHRISTTQSRDAG
jgi:hypothetical protein